MNRSIWATVAYFVLLCVPSTCLVGTLNLYRLNSPHTYHTIRSFSPSSNRLLPLSVIKNPLDIEKVIFSNETSSDGGLTYSKNGKKITFSCKLERMVKMKLAEGIKGRVDGRDVLGYLALPASQYSVLGSEIKRVIWEDLGEGVRGAIMDKVEEGGLGRKGGEEGEGKGRSERQVSPLDDLFTLTLPKIKMFGAEFIPTLYTTVTVSPYPEGESRINILHCTLDGGRMARFADGKFGVDCSTVVEGGMLDPNSGMAGGEWMKVASSVRIICPVPVQFASLLPTRLLSGTGSQVMKGVLRVMLPKFLEDLKGDYELWARGKDEDRDL